MPTLASTFFPPALGSFLHPRTFWCFALQGQAQGTINRLSVPGPQETLLACLFNPRKTKQATCSARGLCLCWHAPHPWSPPRARCPLPSHNHPQHVAKELEQMSRQNKETEITPVPDTCPVTPGQMTMGRKTQTRTRTHKTQSRVPATVSFLGHNPGHGWELSGIAETLAACLRAPR